MYLQAAFYISLSIFAALITTTPSLSLSSDHSYLPSLRLPREAVQELRIVQPYPPGHVYMNITLGRGQDAMTVPVVEADPAIFLDDVDGVRARSLVPRGQCMSFSLPGVNCLINYCWRGYDDVIYSEYITIYGSNGWSNPSRVSSSNLNKLSFNILLNDGYGNWFPLGHECSNDNTMINTNHRMQENLLGNARVDHVRCDSCNFRGLTCSTAALRYNLAVFSNGVMSQSLC
jgi:hypothetical protein